MAGASAVSDPAGRTGGLTVLAVLGLVSAAAYVGVTALSTQFIPGEGHAQRPILLVLALFAVNFVIYLLALWLALRARQNLGLLAAIIGPALAFRAVLLFSTPIQEVDIYRYIWDGAVLAGGENPYRFTPHQVRRADVSPEVPASLARLAQLRDSCPALRLALERIQYAQFPTVYPPVSQAAFVLPESALGPDATLDQHIVLMKLVFVVFDLGTLAVVIGLLRMSGKPLGWTLAYAWCPLVLKEFANSGHLDSLAILLTMLSLFAAARGSFTPASRSVWTTIWWLISAVCLALAVGAKFYPIVLGPLWLGTAFHRLGWRRGLVPLAFFCLLCMALCFPMFVSQDRDSAEFSHDPSRGLKTFLRQWEMNDFFFSLVKHNLQSAPNRPDPEPWFVVLPEDARQQVEEVGASWLNVWLDVEPHEVGFMLARLLTSVIILVIACCLALFARQATEPADWLRRAFLTLAWFWMLLPTQNPWYWLWALPLVAFARQRAWLLVGGFAPLYYLRFWLEYHWPGSPVGPTPYTGAQFFNYVVVWIEYLPWLVLLVIEWVARFRLDRREE